MTRKVSPEQQQAFAHYVFGRKLLESQRYQQAIERFERVVMLAPAFARGYIDYADALAACERWDELIEIAERGLAVDNNLSELQKHLINVLEMRGGIESAFAHFRLKRVDVRSLDIDLDDILSCTVIRNELVRLPFFLDYYRKLGVDRFFFVDNDSSDGSLQFLLRQPDVHVWSSDFDFGRATFGSTWFELLLRRYGMGHWCVLPDADELLVYADCETRTLRQLSTMLEQHGKVAASGITLDMYSDRPIDKTHYQSGDDFRTHCSYFDSDYFEGVYALGNIPYRSQDIYYGGVRQRVFPSENNFLLTKTLFIRYDDQTVLSAGQHSISASAEQIAHNICAVLHFKFFSSLIPYARQEVVRGQHAGDAMQYKAYMRGLARTTAITLYEPMLSVRYKGTQQLCEMGILHPEPGDYVGASA